MSRWITRQIENAPSWPWLDKLMRVTLWLAVIGALGHIIIPGIIMLCGGRPVFGGN